MRRPLPTRLARFSLALTLFVVLTALAQSDVSDSRIIRIESEGASVAGNIRYGPIRYEHPDPEGIRATVANLTIFAGTAVLQVPEDEQGETFINQATGRREANFVAGVRVVRDRLEAVGPALAYRESTGLGTLTGGADVTIEPESEDDDPVHIRAASVEFDVDTDRSVSRGDVQLQNGNQAATAEELVFEEERNLGVLRSAGGQSTVTRESENGTLVISADEIRILTDESRVFATGNVTVVDDEITSTGHTVYFDDDASLAEVIGDPAVSVNQASGVRLESPRIQQDIEFDFVEALDPSAPQPFSPDAFLLQEERPEGS